ncbi:D-amino acid dehydrogenase [Pseudomonas sp. D2002]|uniref:D-amino acid dehydrogenase n=1 Tax=Pseudomonas sp. D2002 TaxID=2726980 RepID=UPI0015A40B48|nr:D-amino acid dehydrogenase [Pseudomonas sp. D2002]
MTKQVCIIGGGVIGLASAYALVRAGMDVTVIEAQNTLGSATSFANGGQLSYRYVAPLADAGVPLKALGWLLRSESPLRIKPRLDPLQWRWMAAFVGACRSSVNRINGEHLLRLALMSQETLKCWRQEDSLGGFDWKQNGKLVTFRSADSFEHARRKVMDPLYKQVLSADECRQLEPSLTEGAFVGGIYTPTEEVADCYAFCQRLAARLEATGRCRFLLGRKVLRIHEAFGRAVAVELQDEVLPVENVVLAAGHRSLRMGLSDLRLPLYPLKGYSLSVPISEQHNAPQINVTDYDRRTVYARIGEQLRVAAMVDIVGFNSAADPGRLAVIKRMARQTFPMAGNYDAAVEWAGMRPATPTGVPLIGPSAYRNLWLNLGHGALGFTLACASGQLLAEMIGAKPTSIDTQAFLPKAA